MKERKSRKSLLQTEICSRWEILGTGDASQHGLQSRASHHLEGPAKPTEDTAPQHRSYCLLAQIESDLPKLLSAAFRSNDLGHDYFFYYSTHFFPPTHINLPHSLYKLSNIPLRCCISFMCKPVLTGLLGHFQILPKPRDTHLWIF